MANFFTATSPMPRALRSRKLVDENNEAVSPPRVSSGAQRVAVEAPAETKDDKPHARVSGHAQRIKVDTPAESAHDTKHRLSGAQRVSIESAKNEEDQEETPDLVAGEDLVEEKAEKPEPKTALERAKAEAVAAFGGGLGDVLAGATKKRSRFDGVTDVSTEDGGIRHVTAKQRAVQEAMDSFGGTGLGDTLVRPSGDGIETVGAGFRGSSTLTQESQPRMTAADKAKAEAVAAFGGGLGDVLAGATKKRSRFDGVTDVSTEDGGSRHVTAKQRAVQEAMDSFGGTGLGDTLVRPSGDGIETVGAGFRGTATESEPAQRQLGRLEQAQAQALEAFGGGLGDILAGATKKRSRFDGVEPAVDAIDDTTHSATQLQRAREQAAAAFGNASLDEIQVKKRRFEPTEVVSVPAERQMSRLEKAKLEAAEAFGGTGLGDTLVRPSGDGIETVGAGFRGTASESHEQPAQRQLGRLEQAQAQALEAFGGGLGEMVVKKRVLEPSDEATTQTDGTRHMSRLERAKLEAQQAFGGVGFDSLGVKMVTTKTDIGKKEEEKKDENE